MRPMLFACTAFVLVQSAAFAASAQDWGCYDPKPGHPTAAERDAFLAEVEGPAKAAEARYGVPAAAIAAMSVVESGYGFTRTALNANNLFGWKQTGAGAAYVLECQPPEDVGNRYVVFASRAEAIDKVAARLANSSYYRADTEAYRQARASGAGVETAVDAWVDGISDPYNWRPRGYAADLKALMRARGLYAWSGAAPVTPAPAPVAPTASLGEVDYARTAWTRKLRGGRYMEGDCELAQPPLGGWDGFPVQRCSYTAMGVQARVFMLNPSADQLARWTASACLDAAANDPKACVRWLVGETWAASNAQFPVTGYVIEPAASAGGSGSAATCQYFRDGVTSRTASSSTVPVQGRCGPEAADGEPALSARKYARISSTTRAMYRAAGGTEEVGEDRDVRWLPVVARLYQEAWGADRNALMSAKAKAGKQAGAFR
ncbi:glucosaminidase domain-containing protein [Caulobacter sp. 17J65-9]|uniref:glucosaminidase domain-containing protein n=1 Tax=Caulobacter sp. 17J65-9 TaxID=2709382 RepID=UPI0013C9266D|nr:glucosaminidase domain-containing protein [Caulobacter sp. 17J65-9]NEX92640.1 glucosaminidase domain-containing protein [Caulobacter sp. 17J65-9]